MFLLVIYIHIIYSNHFVILLCEGLPIHTNMNLTI